VTKFGPFFWELEILKCHISGITFCSISVFLGTFFKGKKAPAGLGVRVEDV